MSYQTLEQIESDVDRKIQRQLNTQRRKALEDIEATRILFNRHKKDYGYEIKMLDKMIVYVMKYKFLPESYNRMLTMWMANFLGKR